MTGGRPGRYVAAAATKEVEVTHEHIGNGVARQVAERFGTGDHARYFVEIAGGAGASTQVIILVSK